MFKKNGCTVCPDCGNKIQHTITCLGNPQLTFLERGVLKQTYDFRCDLCGTHFTFARYYKTKFFKKEGLRI